MTRELSTRFPHLPKAFVAGLALWCFGMLLAKVSGITTVAAHLHSALDGKENTYRQRLREWTYNREHKRGSDRWDFDVTTCFVPLYRWVLALWSPTDRRFPLALDASSLGDRLVVLAICVVIRSCAIPVAWVVVSAATPGSWQFQCRRLLQTLRDATPPGWTVIVLADRGLYSKWLYHRIQRLGWHPFLRVQQQGTFRLPHEATFRSLSTAVTKGGKVWSGRVVCFADRKRQLPCTLLAWWAPGYQDPWLVVTDLAPTQANVAWYGLRSWIECFFKDTKRGGWQWHHTKMTDPQRASRLWLAIAVTTLWAVSVGVEAEVAHVEAPKRLLPKHHVAHRHPKRPKPRLVRALSCFRRGLIELGESMVRDATLLVGRLLPEPWPDGPVQECVISQ